MYRLLLTAILATIIFSACKKKDDYEPLKTADYVNLKIGKVLIYRLDSTVLLPFGSGFRTTGYQAKDSIEAEFLDNSSRKSYRVFRYIRNLPGTTAWAYAATYYITPTSNSVEVIDNNMRFIKLSDVISENNTWKGNAYINTTSGAALSYLDGWDYTYQDINQPYTTLKGDIDSTVTVLQIDKTDPDEPFNPSLQQTKDYSVEVYAKGTGLVYKEFLHWTYGFSGSHYEDGSYGLKLNLLEVR